MFVIILAEFICSNFLITSSKKSNLIASIKEKTPERITIDFDNQDNSINYLLLSQSYFPGWVARFSDGTKVKTYESTVTFPVFEIPPHKKGQIVYTFEDNIIILPLIITLLVLFYLICKEYTTG